MSTPAERGMRASRLAILTSTGLAIRAAMPVVESVLVHMEPFEPA